MIRIIFMYLLVGTSAYFGLNAFGLAATYLKKGFKEFDKTAHMLWNRMIKHPFGYLLDILLWPIALTIKMYLLFSQVIFT